MTRTRTSAADPSDDWTLNLRDFNGDEYAYAAALAKYLEERGEQPTIEPKVQD